MLTEVFGNRIQCGKKASDWKEAVAMAIRPLIDQGYAEERYLEAIYENVNKYGDYFVLMPGFALPHARPEEGSLKTGMSLLKLNEPVVFSEGEKAQLLVGLAAADASSHLDTLAELTDFLMDDDKMEQLYAAETENEIREILS